MKKDLYGQKKEDILLSPHDLEKENNYIEVRTHSKKMFTKSTPSDSVYSIVESKKITPVVEKNNPIQVKTKVISYDSNLLNVAISIPVLLWDSELPLLKEINEQIENHGLHRKEELLKISELNFEECKNENREYLIHELLINYDVHSLNEKLISITTSEYEFTGGAYGRDTKTPYNFDLRRGTVLHLWDLFKENSPYMEILNDEIQHQIRLNPEMFFPEQIQSFKGIQENHPFYLKDGILYIYFDDYEIAPHACGIIEFEIPMEAIKDSLITSVF